MVVPSSRLGYMVVRPLPISTQTMLCSFFLDGVSYSFSRSENYECGNKNLMDQ